MPEGPETLLAFDFGTVRIGVAIGNTLTQDARPLDTLDSRVTDRAFLAIAGLLAEWQPQRLVVGRPLHPDGQAHELTARCERFARRLHGRFRLPVVMVDERYSSVEAEGLHSRAGHRAGATSGGRSTDAHAAAIILRQYLLDPSSARPAIAEASVPQSAKGPLSETSSLQDSAP